MVERDGRALCCWMQSLWPISEYLARYNRAMMILAVMWAKEHELIWLDNVWYKEHWGRGKVLQNDNAQLG